MSGLERAFLADLCQELLQTCPKLCSGQINTMIFRGDAETVVHLKLLDSKRWLTQQNKLHPWWPSTNGRLYFQLSPLVNAKFKSKT